MKVESKQELKSEPKAKTTVKELLSEYSKLAKKTVPEGRKIRKQLRKLGYYLSEVKRENKKTEEK